MMIRYYLPILITALSVCISGCVQFESQPLDLGCSAEVLKSRSLADPELLKFLSNAFPGSSFTGTNRIWTLDELTAAALYLNPSIDLARRRADVAKADILRAAERPNPSVSVTPGYNASTPDPSPWLFNLGFILPIETGGKREYRTAEAQHRAEAERLRIASDAWQVRQAVREALLDVADAQETAEFEAAVVTANETLCAALERQRLAGECSRLDLSQAQVSLHRARLAASLSIARRTQAVARLAAAMGLPASVLEQASFRFPYEILQAPDAADARRAALTGRADVLAALKDYEASQSALQLAIAGQYPDFEIGPGYEYDQGDDKWSLGISHPLPLFNQNKGAIAKAFAQREEASASVRTLQSRIAGEIEQALAAIRAAESRAAVAAALLKSTVDRISVIEDMQKAGEVKTLDVLLARSEVASAKLDAYTVQMEKRRAFGKLEDALQRPATLPETLWSKPETITRKRGDKTK